MFRLERWLVVKLVVYAQLLTLALYHKSSSLGFEDCAEKSLTETKEWEFLLMFQRSFFVFRSEHLVHILCYCSSFIPYVSNFLCQNVHQAGLFLIGGLYSGAALIQSARTKQSRIFPYTQCLVRVCFSM